MRFHVDVNLRFSVYKAKKIKPVEVITQHESILRSFWVKILYTVDLGAQKLR